MDITRRDFLRAYAAIGGALLLKASGLLQLQKAMAGGADSPPLIWLQGQGCTGCSVSLLNSVYYTTIDDLLINKLDMKFHSTVMASAGDLAAGEAETARRLGGYILVVEGAVPLGEQGQYCQLWEGMTMQKALESFAKGASVILAVGTCASYGGMCAGKPNPTGASGVEQALTSLGLQANVINIPGCPAHPDWIVGTVSTLLNGQTPRLDGYKRPVDYFRGEEIHEDCPFHERDEAGQLGQDGCLKELGCKGPRTHADCHIRKWNSPGAGKYGVEWCIGAGSPCIGCVEPVFPDGMSPFYQQGGDSGDGEEDDEGNEEGTVWISIGKSEYRLDTLELTVEASSSRQPRDVLNIRGYGVMQWNASLNKYIFTKKPAANPGSSITVTSASGLSSTVAVTYIGQPSGGVDTVTISSAEYSFRTRRLTVAANSSKSPNAVLTVKGYGAMVWNRRAKRYEYSGRVSAAPSRTITVTSTFGGSAVSPVKYTGSRRRRLDD